MDPCTPPCTPPGSPPLPAPAPAPVPAPARKTSRGHVKSQGRTKQSKIKMMAQEDLPPGARIGERERSRSRSRSPIHSDGEDVTTSAQMLALGDQRAGRTGRKGDRSEHANKKRSAERLAHPPKPFECRVDGKAPVLSSAAGAQHGEEYSKDERVLNDFLRVHPMMSFKDASKEVGELLASMMVRKPPTPPELPCIPKSYDDSMLRYKAQQFEHTSQLHCGMKKVRCGIHFFGRLRA